MAEDVRLAGLYVLERIRRLASWAYPTIAITPGLVLDNSGVRDDLDGLIGAELPVLACFWARTIESPSPAFSGRQVPLIKSWVLAEKKNLHYWLDVHTGDGECSFSVFKGTPQEGRHAKEKRDFKGSKSGFRCLLSGDALTFKSIREYANNKKLGYKLLAVICQAPGKRVYLTPSQEYEEHCLSVQCQDPPNQDLPGKALGFRVQEYGMKKWADLHLPRQLYVLDEFAKEIQQLGSSDEFKDFSPERLEAVKTYLTCALSRLADYNNAFCSWNIKGGSVSHLFTKHAIPMSWDFVEVCPLEDFSGCWEGAVNWVVDVLRARKDRQVESSSLQRDARMTPSFPKSIISTDPPYYDNIGYADLSDFFYVWIRKALRGCYGSILATTLTPKADELIASPFRHPKENADQFFLEGMTNAMTALKSAAHPFAPITIYYAFKQTETGNGGTVQTGWSSFLQAVIKSGLQILGTWPVHTERAARAIGIGTNALASSVVLVCQPVTESRPVFSRSEFKRMLRAEISVRLQIMESASISPVDIAQAVIGPGMAVYSSAKAILNPDDTPIEVREALIEINAILDECGVPPVSWTALMPPLGSH
jgi:putative DNA methylase